MVDLSMQMRGTNILNLYGSANVVGQGNNVNVILIAGAANNTLIGNGTTIIVVLTDSAVTICATPIKTLAANDCAWNQYTLL